MQRYSVQFRNTILQKMIGPEKRKAADLSEEFGVSAATIYGWKSKLKDGSLSVMGNETTSHERIPSEKLMLLLESKGISEAEMGEWLRRNGLHSEHPGLWEQELRALVDQKGGDKSREMREIRKELKKRDKELSRKDKALAEMSTIIALQKKHLFCFRRPRTSDSS